MSDLPGAEPKAETFVLVEVVSDHGAEPTIEPLCDFDGEWPATNRAPGLGVGDIAKARVRREGIVIETLLARGETALAKMYRLAAQHGLNPLFPVDVMRETKGHCDAPRIDDPRLLDLTALPFVTIDYESSRDLDQALYIEALPKGFSVHYALADASFYVRPGSALFREALLRGASYYLPGLCVPMLPTELSEGLISLNPGVDRRSLVFRLELDDAARPVRTDVVRARIRSRAKLTYEGVQQLFDDPTSSPLVGREFTPSLELLRTVGVKRISAVEAANVVRFHRINVEVQLVGTGGLAFEMVGESRNAVEQYNEQISLLCNAQGAELLDREEAAPFLQPIFRVHPAPEHAALEKLARKIEEWVCWKGLEPAVWVWEPRRESLAEYLRRLPSDGELHRLVRALSRQAMLLNHPSRYSSQPDPHFGVGVPAYSRFSAPMREIVGIFTHKELIELLGARDAPLAALDDEELREQVIAAGNRSKHTQSRITKATNELVLDAMFAAELEQPRHERPIRRGTVMGLRQHKLYVLFDDPPIEIKLYTFDLGPHARIDPLEIALVEGTASPICLGDRVDVRLKAYENRRRRWVFEVVATLEVDEGQRCASRSPSSCSSRSRRRWRSPRGPSRFPTPSPSSSPGSGSASCR
ncbi:MAG: RNB domain-containing ribonuclease [Myxococcales bacterium]|nr:RNB domain-containing ribonuclease [Myxococcales bacterium]